jgi:hypothetical protein
MRGIEGHVPFDRSLEHSSQSWAEHVQNFSVANVTSEQFRAHLETRNKMRVELAIRQGKKLQDLVYDRGQMVFRWDGMIHEVMNVMTEESLPNVGDIEPLTANDALTQEGASRAIR